MFFFVLGLFVLKSVCIYISGAFAIGEARIELLI